ncbi:MAG: ATP synthase F1 subunit epsilon [Actinomycetota bacterium]
MALSVRIVTPERDLWSGPASMVIARGVEGEVGILAGHVPMLVSLAIGPLRIQVDEQTEQVVIVDGGFLHVTSDGDQTRIDVLAEQGVLAQDIDPGAIRELMPELERAAGSGDALAKAELAKAQARLAAAGEPVTQ